MSHFAGYSNKLSRHFRPFAALALAGGALAISGCSDDLKVPNQGARIVLVGDLSTAGEACGFHQTNAQSLDGDAGTLDGGTNDISEPDHDANGPPADSDAGDVGLDRSEEHTSELQSRPHLVC